MLLFLLSTTVLYGREELSHLCPELAKVGAFQKIMCIMKYSTSHEFFVQLKDSAQKYEEDQSKDRQRVIKLLRIECFTPVQMAMLLDKIIP